MKNIFKILINKLKGQAGFEPELATPREIAIVGLGVAENAQLTEQAIEAIKNAELVIGSERQLLTLEPYLKSEQQVQVLPKLKALKSLIETQQKIVVLGSGDPLFYGIGTWVNKHFNQSNLQFFPAVSSITQTCHLLGLAQQEIKVVSLHGRPLATLKTSLKAKQTLLLLTDKNSQPQAIAEICNQNGFTNAELTVCERMGYSDQKITNFTLAELLDAEVAFDPLDVTVLNCKKNSGFLPEFPGIEDKHFETGELGSKGMISKREVRLSILSLLQLQKGDLLWDIGAGCGGVAVECAYWQPKATIYAIEHNQTRFDCLLENQQKFGVVSNLKTTFGHAPDVLEDLPAANKIFIGGSDGELPELLNSLWEKLPEGGQIVASGVVEQSKSQLMYFYNQRINSEDCDVQTLQLAINKGATLGEQFIYRPALPVSLFSFVKRSH